MKKKWIFLVLSPIFVWLLWFIVSLIFWILSTLGVDTPLLIAIKTVINWSLGMLSLISIPLLIIGIVLLAKNKDSKIPSGEVINYSRQNAKKHMTRYLLWFVILILLQSLSSYFDWLNTATPNIIFDILSVVITLLTRRLTLWLAKISLSIVYGKDNNILDLFVWFYKTIKYIIAYVISVIITIVWLILLIIPWIIRSFKLSMVPYLILQEWLWPIAAIKKSRKMTKWFVWDMFIINLLAWLINVLWALALLVWLLWTIPLYMIANAYIYKKITEQFSDKPIKKIIAKPAVKISAKAPIKFIKKAPAKKPVSKTVVKKTVAKKPVVKKAK